MSRLRRLTTARRLDGTKPGLAGCHPSTAAVVPSCLRAVVVVLLACGTAAGEPLRLHPRNPHYFLFRDAPVVLVTSGEHYGAVVNLDFKYERYLETLAAAGLNLTRVFVGSYLEKPGDFGIRLNTLAPRPNRAVTPWARSTTDGYAGGGPKFDLDRWDEAYFIRLRDFVASADSRGILVEVVLFSNWYGQGTMSPLHHSNNVNGQNFANHGVPLESVNPQMSVLNFHYAEPEAVAWNLKWRRPVAFDESGFAGADDTVYRRQAWRFLMAGGAVFSGLDYSFAAGFEAGTAANDAPGGGSAGLRSQLGVLRRTLEATGLVALAPDARVVAEARDAAALALSEPGKQYLIYVEGPGKTDLIVNLPAGRYDATWLNARTGRVDRQEQVTGGGRRLLESPDYVTDVVVRIVRR